MSKRPTKGFPARLRAVRERRALTQGELAVRTGLQASAISHFETGTRRPSFDNLRRLADALEVTTDYLLGRVTARQALSGADTLHRHFSELTAEDREIAQDIIEVLLRKSRSKRDEG